MKVTEITVSMGRTMNMGNYESARIETSFTAQLEKDDNPEACASELSQAVAAHLKNHSKIVVEGHLIGKYEREQWLAHLTTQEVEHDGQ